jgi:hypothetical protein
MKLLKKEFKKLIFSLKVEGFEWREDVQSFILIRKSEIKTDEIIFGYKTTASGFVLRKPLVKIYFSEVELSLSKLFEKYQIQNTYGQGTVNALADDLGNVDLVKLEIEIVDEKSFNVVASEILNVVKNVELIFFSTYLALTDVNNSLQKMNEDKISIFLSGIVGIKLPYIKKLVGSLDFKQELAVRAKFYSEEVFKYPQYFKDHDKVFNELFKDDL